MKTDAEMKEIAARLECLSPDDFQRPPSRFETIVASFNLSQDELSTLYRLISPTDPNMRVIIRSALMEVNEDRECEEFCDHRADKQRRKLESN